MFTLPPAPPPPHTRTRVRTHPLLQARARELQERVEELEAQLAAAQQAADSTAQGGKAAEEQVRPRRCVCVGGGRGRRGGGLGFAGESRVGAHANAPAT